jgi:hypothetical protein
MVLLLLQNLYIVHYLGLALWHFACLVVWTCSVRVSAAGMVAGGVAQVSARGSCTLKKRNQLYPVHICKYLESGGQTVCVQFTYEQTCRMGSYPLARDKGKWRSHLARAPTASTVLLLPPAAAQVATIGRDRPRDSEGGRYGRKKNYRCRRPCSPRATQMWTY